MAFVSHTLEWVRALLVGTRATSKSSRVRRARTTSSEPTQTTVHGQAETVSPAMMEAWLVLARLRRARRAAQNAQGEAYVRPHPLVSVYVLPPWQRQHALQSRQLMWTGR